MDSATIDSMCRCCAAEGIFKDIKTSYHWMGEEEVYGDMLRECFDVKLATVEEGGICEVCITQLRNAANFKKQVLHTEKKFKRHLENQRFKATEVKEEVSADNGNSSDDDRGGDSEDDEDYVPDFEIPIKTESQEDPKSRKRAAKATTSRAKKSRVDEEKSNPEPESINEASSVDVISQLTPRQTKIRSIKLILLCSTASPLWSHSNAGYKCAYCNNKYSLPDRLKAHTLDEHDEVTEAAFLPNYRDTPLIMLDTTALTCKLCSENVNNVKDLIEHLNFTHKKRIDPAICNVFHAFKFNCNLFYCDLCPEKFIEFRLFEKHAKVHLAQAVTCDICQVAFTDKCTLQRHYASIHKQQKTKNMKPQEKISDEAKNKLKSICAECGDRFPTHYLKNAHLRKVHRKLEYSCNACDRSFAVYNNLTKHVKKDHLMERPHKCNVCQKAFFCKANLIKHETKHSSFMKYSCDVCGKRFKLRNSLAPHMAIHTGFCRFGCDVCGKRFVQKASWKSHMRTKHEIII